jgi:hypothetical protein
MHSPFFDGITAMSCWLISCAVSCHGVWLARWLLFSLPESGMNNMRCQQGWVAIVNVTVTGAFDQTKRDKGHKA